MEKVGLEEIKKIQIEILDNVDAFCKKNKINYWLDCGTLLGAVRHKGYIPWDDDIDIAMLRKDYDYFFEHFNQIDSKYRVYSVENNALFNYPMAKVLDTSTTLYEPDEKTGMKSSINIDIFVFDNAPDDENKCNKMIERRDLYSKLRYAQMFPEAYDHSILSKRIVRFFLKIYLKILPKNYYTKKVIQNAKKEINTKTKRVANFTSATTAVCDRKVFQNFINMEFEGKKYPVPKDYDTVLTSMYGDYMQLPPKEKRVTHHKFVAYK